MNSLQLNFLEKFDKINFEQIKDHPNILIAANFWEEDRYMAAKTCYKFMRAIDDLIDNHKTDHKTIAANEKSQFVTNVNEWINTLIVKNKNKPLQQELIATFDKFKIPVWPMEAFAKSMIYDIHNDGFASIKSFLEYAEGASVAPASIFVHLCGLQKQNGHYNEPSFNVKELATPCALFSYLVHIIRDFQKDQFNNLNYFADDIIGKNGLDHGQLNEIAHGGQITAGFRNLIQEYYKVADEYRQKTYHAIQNIWPLLEPRYQVSLGIIFNLYLMVFERIDVQNGKFTTAELNPTAEEVKQRVHKVIMDFPVI